MVGGDVLLLARVGEFVVELHPPGPLVNEAVAVNLEPARDLSVDGERGARRDADLVEHQRRQRRPLHLRIGLDARQIEQRRRDVHHLDVALDDRPLGEQPPARG